MGKSKPKKDYLPLCKKCGGRCCQHVALDIEKPTSKTDYDNIRWYLLHENVRVFIDHDKNWLLEFRTPCSNLTKHNLCGCYEDRPDVCRNYPAEDQYCEFESDEPVYKKLFTTAAEFEAWLEKKGKKWRFKKWNK